MTHYKTLDDTNLSEGLHTLFTYAEDTVPGFMGLLLFGIFLILLLGSYYSSRRLVGKGDFPASFAASSFTTFVIAIVMSLIPNLVQQEIVIITLVVATIGMIWLYLSRRDLGI